MKTKKIKAPVLKADGKSTEKQAALLKGPPKRTLDEVWGRQISPYKTTDASVYEKKLNELTTWDLQHEMISVGRTPHPDRHIMIQRLMKDFNQYIATAKGLPQPAKTPKMTPALQKVILRAMGDNA